MPAKSRRRRRRFNLRRVRTTAELPLLTLASDTALTVNVVGASDSQYRMMTIKATFGLRDLVADDGPVTVGFAHSDYTVAEIKECLEAGAAISQGDKIATERANRLVRIVGTFNTGEEMLNDGKPISTRLNWLITIGDSVVLFAFNESTAALATGTILNIAGDLWVKDAS